MGQNWAYLNDTCFSYPLWQEELKDFQPSPKVIKLFSCSTQLSMEFHMLIKSKMLKIKTFAFRCSDVVFIMLINIKMPTIVGILTFMSMKNFILSQVEH